MIDEGRAGRTPESSDGDSDCLAAFKLVTLSAERKVSMKEGFDRRAEMLLVGVVIEVAEASSSAELELSMLTDEGSTSIDILASEVLDRRRWWSAQPLSWTLAGVKAW